MRTWSALLPVLALFAQLACATEPEPTDESSANGTETTEQGIILPPSPPPSDPPSTVCQLPLDPGWCKAYFPSWGFNVRTQRCEQFVYGGCGGNANRFKTQAECERICPAGTPAPRPPITPF